MFTLCFAATSSRAQTKHTTTAHYAEVSQSKNKESQKDHCVKLHLHYSVILQSLSGFQAFLPLLKKAANASGSTGLSCARAAIVNVSTRMGSIVDNTSGGSYPYRTSKVRFCTSFAVVFVNLHNTSQWQ